VHRISLGKAQAQAPTDILARGKALTDAADCASCHTADPAKPFAGGKRIAPLRRDLFA
jgi:mono/diheme cytochrome c family protein